MCFTVDRFENNIPRTTVVWNSKKCSTVLYLIATKDINLYL